ncbi:MAG: heavy metal translocating P-type ATPase, partial [Desulfamplus sp.]|nr:heavy metal translocating P-type ATPase [Desulfamplus sp.]
TNIFSDQPQSVWLLKDGVELEIPIEMLRTGDIVSVNAGEVIPVDGTIVHGMASINQHLLTGEFQPLEKEVGDNVFAATILISGQIHIKVEQAGDETIVSKIGKVLENTSNFTEKIESAGEKIADESVPLTMTLSAIAYPFVGRAGTTALLSSDFLDNLRVTAPIGMLNFLRISSHEGILIKDGRSLQLLPQVDTVVFDKTGTLTLESPAVGKIHTFNSMDENTVLKYAASAEYRQNHPVAKAIIDAADKAGIIPAQIDDAQYRVGYGIAVKIDMHWIRVGSERFMESEKISMPDEFSMLREKEIETGCSLIYVAADSILAGVIEMHPTIRPEAADVVKYFKKNNISVYIISGDHPNPTRILADSLGIDHCFAQVLPEDKANIIERLQKDGKNVCFVGDGINDSIALKKANVSVSLKGASAIATDTAHVILMDESLKKLPMLFSIAFDFQKNMKNSFYMVSAQNIFAVGGIFFLGMGIQAMAVLYIISMLSAAGVTVMPVLKLNKNNEKTIEDNLTPKRQDDFVLPFKIPD